MQEPKDAEARRAVEPVICYPNETLPVPDPPTELEKAAPELEKAVDSEKTEETQAEEAQAEDTEAAAADDEEEDDEVADADAEVEAEGAALGESNRAKAASALEEDA